MSDEPNDFLVHCGPCRHEWNALKLPMPLHEATAIIAKMHCPKCNAPPDRIYCGPVMDKREKKDER